VKRVLTGMCVAFAFAAVPASAGAIQPGDYHETDAGACTLSFVYDGGGGPYMGTAAHCVESVGQDVRLMDGRVFGDVALIGNADVTTQDYAFIQVRPAFVGEVSPAVKGHPTLPRGGFTTPSQTASGDRVQLSGHGLGFGATQPTREQRQAVLGFDDDELYDVTGPLIFGDSGGPLVHLPTGRALGIVSRLCVGVCSEEGPTVQGILAKAAARGFSVTLRTAG
jgi:hypothetical protein